MNTVSFPKSRLLDPWRSACTKIALESGCDSDSRECLGWRDEPHQHLIVTGYHLPDAQVREELKALWLQLHPDQEAPTNDEVDKVIASKTETVESGPWRYFNALEVEL